MLSGICRAETEGEAGTVVMILLSTRLGVQMEAVLGMTLASE